eukprot:SAG22_NODE_142_length_17922_cov_10.990406_9_plen_109_part_00
MQVKRPTGQGIDAFLHVNPKLPAQKALAMVFNPTTAPRTENLSLPLYYAGLTDTVQVSVGGAAAVEMTLGRDYSVVVPVSVPAKATTWILFEDRAASAIVTAAAGSTV